MERFNWQGLIAVVLASAGASLLISLADERLSFIEAARALVQAIIAVAAFVERPKLRAPRGGGHARGSRPHVERARRRWRASSQERAAARM